MRAVAKWDGRNFYVIAGSAENTSSTASFSIPCVGNAAAAVIGENRTLQVTSGAFSIPSPTETPSTSTASTAAPAAASANGIDALRASRISDGGCARPWS